MKQLPPGFVLEEDAAPPQAPAQPQIQAAPLPPGFVLEGSEPAAPDNRSFLGKLGDGVTRMAKEVANARLSDMVKGMAQSAKSAVTLPGDVYAGRVDPLSEEGFNRTQELASFASPIPAGAAAKQVIPAALPRAAQEASEMGVTLTAGQRTGNPALLSREDGMLGGAYGPRAQEVAQGARARQADEIVQAREAIGDVAGKGMAQLERPAQAGAIVADAVKDIAANQRQGFKQQYDEAFSSQGMMKPEAFQGISGRITESLVKRGEPVIIDDVLTPAANRALKELDNIQNLKLGNIGQPAAGEIVEGISLRGVDQARRKLVAFYGAAKPNPTDRRAMQGIINEFDDQIEQAVNKGLFSGDEKFLSSLKDARASYANYQRTFRPTKPGDDVGRALSNIIEREATPEQVANYLYGSAKIGAAPTSVRLAGRLKQLLGDGSPEWGAIRQGAWKKMTDVAEGRTPMGPQKASERIFEFLNGDGKSLATQLFSAEERKLMGRYANMLKATTQKPGTVNNSNSGNRVAALARESLATITSMLGATASGPAGAAAGYAAGKGLSAIGGMRAGSQARQLFSGKEPVPLSFTVGKNAARAGQQLMVPGGLQLLQQQPD